MLGEKQALRAPRGGKRDDVSLPTVRGPQRRRGQGLNKYEQEAEEDTESGFGNLKHRTQRGSHITPHYWVARGGSSL